MGTKSNSQLTLEDLSVVFAAVLTEEYSELP
jgi:hypothetical protein